MSTYQPKSDFRYDINTLRAIAVVGVVLYHYKVAYFDGGFTGVDVFFVISGYLMTKIVFSGISKNNFSYKDFIIKRTKRIVPALLFLLVILSTIGFFIYLPEDYKKNMQSSFASITFLSNVLYWQNANSYFAPASETNILLHTWSLSVEWQFYLLYPVILLFFNRLFKKKGLFLLFFAAAVLVVMSVSFYITSVKPDASFYLIPTRSWEMAFGGLSFFTEGLIKEFKARKHLAIVGYIGILYSFLTLNISTPWPNVFTLIPVASTFLVIISNNNNSKLIRIDVIQFLGKISYSLYLWHWPVYVIGQYFGFGDGVLQTLSCICISIVLAAISFKYIESAKLRTPNIMVAMTSFAVISGVFSFIYANRFLFNKRTIEIANYYDVHKKEIESDMAVGSCFNNDWGKDINVEQCLDIIEGKKNILLLGDSQSASLVQSLKERIEGKNIHLMQASVAGGSPAVRIGNPTKVINYIYSDFIPKNANKIDGVILCSHWALYKNKKVDQTISEIKDAISFFNQYTIDVILIGQSETYKLPYPVIAARDYQYNTNTTNRFLEPYDYHVDSVLSKNLGSYYIKVINSDSFPGVSSTGVPYIWDRLHHSRFGANLLVDKVVSDSIAIRFFNK